MLADAMWCSAVQSDSDILDVGRCCMSDVMTLIVRPLFFPRCLTQCMACSEYPAVMKLYIREYMCLSTIGTIPYVTLRYDAMQCDAMGVEEVCTSDVQAYSHGHVRTFLFDAI